MDNDVVLLLGNNAPHEVHKPESIDKRGKPVWGPKARGAVVEKWDGVAPHRVHKLELTESPHTRVIIPAGKQLGQALGELERAWRHHSSARPGWVTLESDGQHHELFRSAVAQHLGVAEPGPGVVQNLLTKAGIDFIAAQMSGSASATAVAKWVALTASTLTPADTDTTLSGEITTAGGGLVRAAGTYAHTTGASTYTVTITFTANGSDALPVATKAAGVFTASAAGSLVFEDTFAANLDFNASGDAGTVTLTVTL